jgi:hypothetical protein
VISIRPSCNRPAAQETLAPGGRLPIVGGMTTMLRTHELGLSHDLTTLRLRGMLSLDNGTTVAALNGTGGELAATGLVRSDLRRSFGKARGRAAGGPVVVTIGGFAPGQAVYAWQDDRDGRYSLHTPGLEDQNWLRGIQVADGSGEVTFTVVQPRVHLEVVDLGYSVG